MKKRSEVASKVLKALKQFTEDLESGADIKKKYKCRTVRIKK